MTPKAHKRTLKTTRPRRSAARIAQGRAPKRASAGRDDDSTGNKKRVKGNAKSSASSTSRGRSGNKKKAPGRATRVKRREQRTEVRRGRFLLLVGFMSALGFATVYLGDAALGTIESLGKEGQTTSLWEKIVDRLLDRDIPVVEKPTPKKQVKKVPAAARPKALEKRPALPQKTAPVIKVEHLPRAPVPSTPRAELPAPSPVEYARKASADPRPSQPDAKAVAAERAARIEALLESVGVER